jgi:hypothetical protein
VYKLDPPPPKIRVRTAGEIKQGDTISAGLGLVLGVPNEASRPSRAEIANPPDWTLYPVAFSGGPPDLQSPDGSIQQRLNAALAPIRFRLAETRTNGTTLEFVLAPTAVRAPLACDELWAVLPAQGMAGFEAVSFESAVPGQAALRCMKFLNPALAPQPSGVQGAPLPVAGPTRERGWWDDKAAANKIADAVATILKRQRLALEAVKFEPNQATIYFYNATYPSAGRAIGRAARAMTEVLPPSIEMITLVTTTGNLNGTRLAIPRAALERAAQSVGSSDEILISSTLTPAPPGLPRGSYKPAHRFPAFRPILAPAYRHSLFDPDDPLRIQLYVRGGAEIELFRGFLVSGNYAFNIYNNFDTITRASGSVLPHVRSDTARYLREGASGVEKLEVAFLRQLAPEIYGRISAGYLEDMYGGVDGELLYRPFGRRWAIGLEAAHVYKRDFDRRFGFQDFEATTGHVSLYYESPYHGLNLNVHAGRYVAGDWGATFELLRRFDSGAEIGAFATFTDVPFDKFGEGSFDKGIVIRFPFDLVSLFSTRQTTQLTLRPLTRDGGARLDVDHRLYEETRAVSYGDTVRNWGDLLARH